MYLHRSFNRHTSLPLALAVVLIAATFSPGFSRDRSRSDRHPRSAQHRTTQQRRPQRVETRHRTIQNRHYSYRRGRWFSVTPRARIAVGAPFGALVLSIPGVFRTGIFGGLTYYYSDGVFYHRHDHGYEIVRAPRVRYLPHGARRVVIGGCPYFHHDNFYYRYNAGYFEVCEPPVAVADIDDAPVATTTIMIENSNGSRTPVNLEPMGSNQWKGPKGEIYDGIPTEDQLRDAYGF